MTEAAVLDALATETLLGNATDEAITAGDTLVRLLDDTGGIRNLVRISPAPVTPDALHSLQRRLRTDLPDPHGVAWQYWNGHVWRHLTHTAGPDQPAAGSDVVAS
jgi:hypothetical protein